MIDQNQKLAIFELDGPVVNTSARLDHSTFEGQSVTYKKLGLKISQDNVFLDVPARNAFTFLNALHNMGWHILYLVSRPEVEQQPTMDWLVQHELVFGEIDTDIAFGPGEGYNGTAEWKASMIEVGLESFENPSEAIVMIVDPDANATLKMVDKLIKRWGVRTIRTAKTAEEAFKEAELFEKLLEVATKTKAGGMEG